VDVWHVNTTEKGGGVAEILTALQRAGDTADFRHRRFVTSGDPAVFGVTKRLHHRLHGVDRGPLPDPTEHIALLAFAETNARRLLRLVRPVDLIVLHDPQTLAMAPHLAAAGVPLAWRCHIGTAASNEVSATTWDYLSRFWPREITLVFSVPQEVPLQAARHRVVIIAPSIDLNARKNRPLRGDEVRRILSGAGLTGTAVPSASSTAMISDTAIGDDPMLLQVSRWDPLKDMAGILRAFAESALTRRAHLVLCGPSPAGVADDPDAAEVLEDVVARRAALPTAVRRKVHLACPDLGDEIGNALLVNALQTRAEVVIQKSLQEGFGLTVTEAMVKSCAVVASGVGGISSQIVSGRSGVLLNDPHDLIGLAAVVQDLLENPGRREALGRAARERVLEHFTLARETADHHRLYRMMLGEPGAGDAAVRRIASSSS
jgi:trehalose synthase